MDDVRRIPPVAASMETRPIDRVADRKHGSDKRRERSGKEPSDPKEDQSAPSEIPEVDPAAIALVNALDRLRATNDPTPVDNEFLRLVRGMRHYRQLREENQHSADVEEPLA